MISRPKLGAHVSAAGGLWRAVINAQEIEAETIQIFGALPRQWKVAWPTRLETDRFREEREKNGLRSVFLHAAYLVNLGSADRAVLQKSITNLSAHLQIAETLGAEGLIFHVGSGGKEKPKAEAMKQAVSAMKEVLENVPGHRWLVMENSASAKKIGATAEEMQTMLEGVNSPRIKICLDTAHSLEAGIIVQYDPVGIEQFLDEWDKMVGLENVVALHANDSKTPGGSNHDRHENIGEGHIGLEGFKNLAKEKRLWNKPWILEVPGFDNRGPDKRNLDVLKSLFKTQ